MICFPNAKINLGLRILRKREDMFHDIETCLIPVPLYDVLEFYESDKFSIEVFGADLHKDFKENIIYKTWLKLTDAYDIPPFAVSLLKNIATQAGLGGGSSDAAFFLKEVNKNYNLGITQQGMEMFLESIGSDCPFFVRNLPAMAFSKGEVIEISDVDLRGLFVTILKPFINISTADAYKDICPKLYEKPLAELLKEPISIWKDNIFNDFEKIFSDRFPEFVSIKENLYKPGADYVSLSGSGSAVYALSENKIDVSGINADFIWQGRL